MAVPPGGACGKPDSFPAILYGVKLNVIAVKVPRVPRIAAGGKFGVDRFGQQHIGEKAGPGLVSAVDKLVDQVASENDSVAQRAAKELIDLFADAVMNESDREIVVRIEGMPELGMPEPPREAEA